MTLSKLGQAFQNETSLGTCSMDQGISNIHESTWKHFDVLITFFIISLRIFLIGFKVLKVLCHMSLKPGNLNFYLFSMCFVNLILSRVSPHLIFFHAEILARSWGTSCSSRPPLLDLFRSLGIAQQTMDTCLWRGQEHKETQGYHFNTVQLVEHGYAQMANDEWDLISLGLMTKWTF